MSGFGVVLYSKGKERSSGRRAKFPNWFIIVWIEASPFSRRESRVFDPELEFAICAYGGYEVGMDRWRKPLNLIG